MLAIDVPISALAGLVLAEGGKKMLASGDAQKRTFMRVTTLLYAVFFITPIPFYFFLGWPAWETNFLWSWPDNLHDSPSLAAGVAFGVFIMTVAPTYLALELGTWLIRKDKAVLVRAGYIALSVLVGFIVYFTRDITFNIASTYAKYEAKEFYSFWSHPFFTGWLIVTVYFWGSLGACYLWLLKRDRE